MSTGTKVIQFTTFPASEAFMENRAYFSTSLERIADANGLISSFWGLQVPEEGAKMGYLITVWDSSEHYRKFTTSDLFTSGMATLKEAAAGDLTRYQFIGVHGSPAPGLNASITEVVIVKPNAGISGTEIKEAAYSLSNIFNSHGHPAAFGESVNGDGVYLIVVGWPSVSESRTVVKTEPFASKIGAFESLAKLSLSHTNLDRRP